MAKVYTPDGVFSLYGGDINIEFHEQYGRRKHVYLMNGEIIPMSVTGITKNVDKPQLVQWAANMACDFLVEKWNSESLSLAMIEEARYAHKRYTEAMAETGTQVHDWARRFIEHQVYGFERPELPEDGPVMNGVLGFLRWIKEHDVKFVSAERCIYSKKYGYVGRMDAEAYVDGKLRVIDFKTSKAKKGKEGVNCDLCGTIGCGGVYEEHRFQTAGYQLAAEEEGTTYDGNRIIARFDKITGEFQSHELPEFEEDAGAFIGQWNLKKRLIELGA